MIPPGHAIWPEITAEVTCAPIEEDFDKSPAPCAFASLALLVAARRYFSQKICTPQK